MEYSSSTARTSRRPALAITALAFVLGALLAGYAMWRFGDEWLPRETAPSPASAPTTALPPADPAPTATGGRVAAQAVQAVEAAQIVAQQQGGLDQRLAAAEQRIARLDLQAQAAAGNAIRAEGLLIAFSARRALDRGNNLGFLGDQLRLRFGDAMPNAVATLIGFGRQPVTLDQLIAQLDGLAPDLANSARPLSWEQLSGEVGKLFVVRRESTPSPQPRRRLERARMFLQTGRVEAAVAEVRNLPGATKAAAWIAAAERYAATQNALDLIETAAVLEPRRLRDGEGRPIAQPSGGAAAAPAPAPATSGA